MMLFSSSTFSVKLIGVKTPCDVMVIYVIMGMSRQSVVVFNRAV